MINKDKLKNQLLKLIYNSNRSFNKVKYNIDKLLNSYKTINEPLSILVTQLGGMGDLILASAAIREIRNNFPNAYITLICTKQWTDIVKYCPYINEIIPSIANNATYFSSLASSIAFCYKFLWNRTYDIAFNLHYNISGFLGSIINWLAIVKESIGYSFDAEKQYFYLNFKLGYFEDDYHMDNILTKPVINPFYMYHEADRKLYLLKANNLKVNNKHLEVFLNNIYNINSKDNIAVMLGTSSNAKKYPVNKLIKILPYIKENIILLGNKEEITDADFISKHIKCINLVNKTSILESISVLKQCKLYIGNDTGLAHAAAALDIPTITYIAEAKNKSLINPGSKSAKERFSPYHITDNKRDLEKSIILQPDKALDKCNNLNFYGGCISNQAHCITQINENDIILAYYTMKNKFF